MPNWRGLGKPPLTTMASSGGTDLNLGALRTVGSDVHLKCAFEKLSPSKSCGLYARGTIGCRRAFLNPKQIRFALGEIAPSRSYIIHCDDAAAQAELIQLRCKSRVMV